MNLDRKGKLLCGCIIVGLLCPYAVAAPSGNADTSSYAEEKAMESNVKKSLEKYEAALKKFEKGDATAAKESIEQSLVFDAGNSEAQALKAKIAAKISQDAAIKTAAEKLSRETAEKAAADKKKAAESVAAAKAQAQAKAGAQKYYDQATKAFAKGDGVAAQKSIEQSLAFDAGNVQAQALKAKITGKISQDAAIKSVAEKLSRETAEKAAADKKKAAESVVAAQAQANAKAGAQKNYDIAVKEFAKGDVLGAQKSIEQSLTFDAGNPEALALNANISGKISQDAAAKVAAEKLSRETAEKAAADKKKAAEIAAATQAQVQAKEGAKKYYDMAAKALAKGDALGAQKSIAQSLAFDAGNAEALVLSAKISGKISQDAAAKVAAEKLSRETAEKATADKKKAALIATPSDSKSMPATSIATVVVPTENKTAIVASTVAVAGLPDKATEENAKLMEMNTAKSIEYYNKSVKKFTKGDYSGARNLIDKSLELDQNNQEARDFSWKITERINQQKAAIAESKKIDSVAVSSPIAVALSVDEKAMESNIKNAIEYYDTAAKDFAAGNLPSAKKYIEKSLALDRENPEALALSQKIAERTNEETAAAVVEKQNVVAVSTSVVSGFSVAEEWARKNKEKSTKYYGASRKDFEKGNLTRAKKNVEQALKLDPENQEARDLSWKIAERVKQESVALTELEKNGPVPSAPIVSPSASRRWLKRAMKAYRIRDIEVALTCCKTAVQSDPANQDAVRLEKRLVLLQMRLDAVKSDMVESHLAKAAVLIRQENPIEALWWINRATEIVPDDTRIAGLQLSTMEAAKNILPKIEKSSQRKKIARIVACFVDQNYIKAELLARELQENYPLAANVTVTVQNHLLDIANQDRSNDEYLSAMKDTMTGYYENAFYEVKCSLYFDPYNFAARCLLEQIRFEMIDTTAAVR